MAWPKLTKNANFGPNLVVFGQKILFFTGEIKSFVTHITENPPRHLVHIVFWSGIGQKVQKMAIFIYTSDIYYHGVDTTSSSFKKEQCDYPDPLE